MLAFLMAIEDDHERNKVIGLYQQYYSTMFYVAKSILNDYSLAEDAVSEAFIRIIKNVNKIGELHCHQTRAFVVVIVRNIALDMLRSQKSEKVVPFEDYDQVSYPDDTLFENMSTKEACKRITDCIETLNPNYRDILYLKVRFQYTNEEISELLNISPDNAKKRLSRARTALLNKLAEEETGYDRTITK